MQQTSFLLCWASFLWVSFQLLGFCFVLFFTAAFSPQSFFCFLMPRAKFFPFFSTTVFLPGIPSSSDLASNAAAVHLNFVVLGQEKNGTLAHGL